MKSFTMDEKKKRLKGTQSLVTSYIDCKELMDIMFEHNFGKLHGLGLSEDSAITSHCIRATTAYRSWYSVTDSIAIGTFTKEEYATAAATCEIWAAIMPLLESECPGAVNKLRDILTEAVDTSAVKMQISKNELVPFYGVKGCLPLFEVVRSYSNGNVSQIVERLLMLLVDIFFMGLVDVELSEGMYGLASMIASFGILGEHRPCMAQLQLLMRTVGCVDSGVISISSGDVVLTHSEDFITMWGCGDIRVKPGKNDFDANRIGKMSMGAICYALDMRNSKYPDITGYAELNYKQRACLTEPMQFPTGVINIKDAYGEDRLPKNYVQQLKEFDIARDKAAESVSVAYTVFGHMLNCYDADNEESPVHDLVKERDDLIKQNKALQASLGTTTVKLQTAVNDAKRANDLLQEREAEIRRLKTRIDELTKLRQSPSKVETVVKEVFRPKDVKLINKLETDNEGLRKRIAALEDENNELLVYKNMVYAMDQNEELEAEESGDFTEEELSILSTLKVHMILPATGASRRIEEYLPSGRFTYIEKTKDHMTFNVPENMDVYIICTRFISHGERYLWESQLRGNTAPHWMCNLSNAEAICRFILNRLNK